MIRSFRDKETEKIFLRERSRKLPVDVQRIALRKLVMFDAAQTLQDLRMPPGNRLEKLSGGREGQQAFASTTSGAYVSVGRRAIPTMSRSRIITRRSHGVKLAPVHPGEILVEEFLKPYGVSQYRLAKDIRVPPRRINEIVHGTRAITADTALRLARYFGTSPFFWMNLQGRYDLEVERDRLGRRLEKEIASFALSAR